LTDGADSVRLIVAGVLSGAFIIIIIIIIVVVIVIVCRRHKANTDSGQQLASDVALTTTIPYEIL